MPLVAMASVAYQLLRQRDLLQLHLVNTGRSRCQQRARRKEDGRLHDDNEAEDASNVLGDAKNAKVDGACVMEELECMELRGAELGELWRLGLGRRMTTYWRLNWHVRISPAHLCEIRTSETLRPDAARTRSVPA